LTLTWLSIRIGSQLSWFPFFQYNTDWMGREIYHGEPQGLGSKADAFNAGVREGAVGLLFCSIALGVTSFLIPKLCRKLTSRVVWSISNLMVFAFMTVMVVLGMISMKGYKPSLTAGLIGPDPTFRGIALAVFALIGIPQAVSWRAFWIRCSFRILSCCLLIQLLRACRCCSVSHGPWRLRLPPRRAEAKVSPLASSTSPSSFHR
jgi:hypothetical protein